MRYSLAFGFVYACIKLVFPSLSLSLCVYKCAYVACINIYRHMYAHNRETYACTQQRERAHTHIQTHTLIQRLVFERALSTSQNKRTEQQHPTEAMSARGT